MAQETTGNWITPLSEEGIKNLKIIINGVDMIGIDVENGKFNGLIVTYFDSILLESGLIKGTELMTIRIK